jgi:hypothetical protein
VIPETNNFFLTAEQLKDGMIAPFISGNYDYRYFDGTVVVVFSNNPPPTYILFKENGKSTKLSTIMKVFHT